MRTCPFDGCGAQIPDEMFACRRHWCRLPRPLQTEIWVAYRSYLAGHIDVEELRRRQRAVLDAAQGRATP